MTCRPIRLVATLILRHPSATLPWTFTASVPTPVKYPAHPWVYLTPQDGWLMLDFLTRKADIPEQLLYATNCSACKQSASQRRVKAVSVPSRSQCPSYPGLRGSRQTV